MIYATSCRQKPRLGFAPGRRLLIRSIAARSDSPRHCIRYAATSAALLDTPAVAKSGLVETPLPSSCESCWTAVDVWYALSKPGLSLTQRAKEIYACLFEKKDAYFDPYDVLPFLALHYVHIPTLLARQIRKGNRWAKIDMCIGKLTEENGD